MNFFGVGFGEIFLILLIVLVVVGPERLPGLARQTGLLIARTQSWLQRSPDAMMILQARKELEREIDNLRREFAEMQQAQQKLVSSTKEALQAPLDEIRSIGQEIKSDLGKTAEEFKDDLQALAGNTPEPSPVDQLELPPSATPVEQLDAAPKTLEELGIELPPSATPLEELGIELPPSATPLEELGIELPPSATPLEELGVALPPTTVPLDQLDLALPPTTVPLDQLDLALPPGTMAGPPVAPAMPPALPVEPLVLPLVTPATDDLAERVDGLTRRLQQLAADLAGVQTALRRQQAGSPETNGTPDTDAPVAATTLDD